MPGLPPRPGDVDPELEFHVEMQTRRYVAEGLAPDEARRAALDRLGDLDRVRHACRHIDLESDQSMSAATALAACLQDLRYAWRGLRRAPAFALTAVVTLALGIGATTAMFSVFHAAMVGALPYAHAPRLAMVWNTYGPSLPFAAVSAAEFADMLDAPGAFDGLAALQPRQVGLGGACANGAVCDPERVEAYAVSPNLFDLAGVAPVAGRSFTAADGAVDAPAVVVLSHALWLRRYAGDDGVIGGTVVLAGAPATIVGVMPPDVRLPDEPLGFLRSRADLWLAHDWTVNRGESRGNQNLGVLGRIAAGRSVDDARRQLEQWAAGFRQAFPDRYAREEMTWGLRLVPFREQMVGDVRTALVALLAAVGLVLLVACVNVAGLQLTRSAGRGRELAVREALGAGRRRLVSLLLTEAALLAAAGVAAGVFVAWLGLAWMRQLDPGTIPRLDHAVIDWRILLFASTLGLVTAVVVGLWPALRLSRTGAGAALADGGSRGAAVAAAPPAFRRALVIVEVALAVVVLVGAGLLGRSLTALGSVSTGVSPAGVVTFQVSPPRDPYASGEPVVALHERILGEVRALPGVTHAATVDPLPMSGSRWSGTFGIDGRPVPDGQPDPHAELAAVSPGYFEAAGIRLIDGRDFADTDRRGTPPVVVIDERLAEQYWPGERAVGKRVDTDGRLDPPVATVIGVVAHVRNGGPRDDGEPQLYLAEWQFPARNVSYVVRANDPAVVLGAARTAVRAVDPQLPIARLVAMDDLVDSVFARDRFNAWLLSGLAVVALALAVVGLYGVLSQQVAGRSREIGIRLALGGRPVHVARRVLVEGIALAAVGVAAGLALAALAARGLGDLLFGVTPTDAPTYATIAVALVATAAAASIIPMRRALRVDPVDVLRE